MDPERSEQELHFFFFFFFFFVFFKAWTGSLPEIEERKANLPIDLPTNN